MNVRCVSELILVTRKLIIEVLFNDLIYYEWGICISSKIKFNVSYVVTKRIPVVTNFKQPIKYLSNIYLN